MGQCCSDKNTRRLAQGKPAGRRCGGKTWLVLADPCGIVCCVLVYGIAINALLLVNRYVLAPRLGTVASWAHSLCYNYVVVAMLVSHLRCLLTDPGVAMTFLDVGLIDVMRLEYRRLRDIAVEAAVARVEAEDFAMPRQREMLLAKAQETSPFAQGQHRWWCLKCDTFKPRHAHHCSICRCCVLEMDHHCPWVNNCVGWRNHKFFVLFVWHAWIGCLWSAASIIYAMAQRPETSQLFRNARAASRRSGPRSLLGRLLLYEYLPPHQALHTNALVQLWCILICVVCFLLVIFTSVMCFDQFEYMAKGYGVIDRKMISAEAKDPAPTSAASPVPAASAAPPEALRISRGTVCRASRPALIWTDGARETLAGELREGDKVTADGSPRTAATFDLEQLVPLVSGGVVKRSCLTVPQPAGIEGDNMDEDPAISGKVELWEVLGGGWRAVRVLDKKSPNAKAIEAMAPGSKIRGRREGNWVTLADEPGFMMLKDEHGKPLLRLTQRRCRLLSKALCFCDEDWCGCCGCCGVPSCEKLPQVMGEPLSVRWLLPAAPRGDALSLAVVPEDALIAEARERYARAFVASAGVEECAEASPAGASDGLRCRRPDGSAPGLPAPPGPRAAPLVAGGSGVFDARGRPGGAPPGVGEYEDSDSGPSSDDECC